MTDELRTALQNVVNHAQLMSDSAHGNYVRANQIRETAEAQLAALNPPPDPKPTLWMQANNSDHIDPIIECVDILAPHISGVYLTCKYYANFSAFLDWTNAYHTTLPVYPGLLSTLFFDNNAILNVGHWERLRREAEHRCGAAFDTKVCLVDNEALLAPFNRGDDGSAIDYDALHAALEESGMIASDIQWVWYLPEALPDRPWTLDLTSRFAKWFPTARVMDSNLGAPAHVTDAAYIKCATAMQSLWGDRRIHRILFDHPDNPHPRYYDPHKAVEITENIPKPNNWWLVGDIDAKAGIARAIAEAYEANA